MVCILIVFIFVPFHSIIINARGTERGIKMNKYDLSRKKRDDYYPSDVER